MNSAPETPEFSDPKLQSYYSNRPLMWRNLSFILLLNLGWAVSFTVVGPLMRLRVNEAGLHEGGMGLINSINAWAYSFLVMYFAWKSDHTVSRLGRRIPYLFISAPVIIVVVVFFPIVHSMWILVVLWLLQMLFTDIKAATIPLLNIDCMPRKLLARTGAPAAILTAIVTFFALREGMALTDIAEWLPYFAGAAILLATTLIGGFAIKEPPVQSPTTEKFRPWSAMKVALKDRRKVVQMTSCAMFQTFLSIFGAWIWLYAVNKLNLSRTEVAHAMSWSILCGMVVAFPMSWLVDRFSPYRLMPIFCILTGVNLWLFLEVRDVTGLIIASCLQTMILPLYNSADIMIYRASKPEEIGSVTSTNSCLRGFYNGCVAVGMGWIIEASGGNYAPVFIIGFILTIAGLIPLYLYRYMMRHEAGASDAMPAPVQTTV